MASNITRGVPFFLLWLSAPFCEQTPPRDAEGTWEGTLDVDGVKLRLIISVAKSGPESYSGTLESVDQGATLPLDLIQVKGESVRLEVKSVGAAYEGSLNKDRTELTGKFAQAGRTFPLLLRRAEAKPKISSSKARPLDAPLDVYVRGKPTAFKAAGQHYLAYEIHITNFGREECLLRRIAVLDSEHSIELTGYDEEGLIPRLMRPGVVGTDRQRLAGGQRAVIFLWLTVQSVPSTLRHRIGMNIGGHELSVDCAEIAVDRDPVVIGPPLAGGEWLAGNGPSNNSIHRRALLPIGGRAQIAQRFAIDWLRLHPDGRTFSGDPKNNRSYRCYGVEALAVADGTVAAVKDGIPENVPGINSRAVPITLETIGGNHVILDLGRNRFAFYAHLQPGHLRVKAGDNVRRGQVLGLVGNSGNSTEPHLHFHLCDANSPIGSEGLPYGIDSFEVQGKGRGWKPSAENDSVQKRVNEMPLENEVVRFHD